MKNGIPSEHFYKLLEWKDANMDEFLIRYNYRRLRDLTTEELKELYNEVILKNDNDNI
jgi:hypothetical protein